MSEPPLSAPSGQDLGFFYDTLHGRIALDDLPRDFHPALKSALASRSLDRLKRISQLGHTSVSFFSATHTRFSHAIGTMLVMNKLFMHVCPPRGMDSSLSSAPLRGLPPAVFTEVEHHYPKALKHFGNARNMIHCHLLLAALYQDAGELPFQKVTSLYFTPADADVRGLANTLFGASPHRWNSKKVFGVSCLARDMKDSALRPGFEGYDLEFLSFLMTGDGAPRGTLAIQALLQMVDGIIDADRLDYVYRDASVTIGSLSRPTTVLESVLGYDVGRVIVDDPRPATDFLSTRMRLWTFVYSSPDVRFRQVLLKTVLDGIWDRSQTKAAFALASLEPALTHDLFMELDDSSLMARLHKLDSKHLEPYRQQAMDLLLRGTLDYECRILKRQIQTPPSPADGEDLPAELFFDLLQDHGHHQLYHSDTIFVRQGLTSRIQELLPLEKTAGAFSPLFAGQTSAILVPDAFYLFLPRVCNGSRWSAVEASMDDGTLYQRVAREDARRSLGCPSDTLSREAFNDFSNARSIAISYCSQDLPTVIRIIRELNRQKRRYLVFLRTLDGTGTTPSENSSGLIIKCDAVLAIVSTEYLYRAMDGDRFINIEVGEILGRSRDIPVVALGVDSGDDLNSVPKWNWGRMCHAWRDRKPVIPADLPLRNSSDETLRTAIDKAIQYIDAWEPHR